MDVWKKKKIHRNMPVLMKLLQENFLLKALISAVYQIY